MTDEALERGLREAATDLAIDVWQAASAPLLARIAELEKQLATARDDALEEAALKLESMVNSWHARTIRALKSQREAT